MWLFLSLEHLRATVGLLTGVISVLCLRIGRPEERERQGNSIGGVEHTPHLSIKFAVLAGHGLVMPQSNYSSNINWSQITLTNTIMMKMFEIFWELTNVTDTWSEQMLEKWQIDLFDSGCHKPSPCKKHSICEVQLNEQNKTRYACNSCLFPLTIVLLLLLLMLCCRCFPQSFYWI